MANDPNRKRSRAAALHFAASLKAARDFGLDQASINAIALGFDPQRPDLDRVTGALAHALLVKRPLPSPDAA